MKTRSRVLLAQQTHLPAVSIRDTIIERVSGYQSLRRALAEHRPDVALVSLDLPGLGGASGLRELSKISPDTKVVAMTDHVDDAEELDVLRAGARGYVRPSDQSLPKVLEKIEEGEVWAARRTIGRFFDEIFSRAAAPPVEREDPFERLTRREQQILRLLGKGMSNKAIAEALDVSVPTVKAHLTNMYRKLGQPDRLHLALAVRDR